MTGAMPARADAATGRAWRILVFGVLAQASVSIVIFGPGFLIPFLESHRGYTLGRAGAFAAAPTAGLVFTLIAWGALADRIGERAAICAGLILTGLSCLAGSAAAHSTVAAMIALACAGAAAASVNSASGRVVAGWFPRRQRGLAMGIRQMSQPLGVAVAALTVPALGSAFGVAGFFLTGAVITLTIGVACLWGVVDPPERADAADAGTADADAAPAAEVAVNPYRADGFLWRIHLVSTLLVIPQYTLSTFGLVWLISTQGLHQAVAGAIVAAAQFTGAAGRIVIGGISDKTPSRVGVLRTVAWMAVALVGLTAAVSLLRLPWAAAAVFIAASTISVADNGIAFTSVAEAAGPAWSGKALGAQNTGQYLATAVVGPAAGAAMGAFGYPIAFVMIAVAPAAAIFLVPRRDVER